MIWDGPARTEQANAGRLRLPRRFALAASLIGSTLGVATNLYSPEFRSFIDTPAEALSPTFLSVVLAALVAGASTVVLYRWLLRRRQQARIAPGEIHIHADALQVMESEQDSVVGRSLHYLEAKRESDDLVVFLHGLGLDANDFRAYVAESKFHCIALTLYGFNSQEKNDEHYPPISLRSHTQLLGYALRRFRRQYPTKRLTLVGFSFGADVVMLLTQFAPKVLGDLKIHKVVLLDPNINKSTTTISSKIARVDEHEPLPQLVKVVESAANIAELRYLCEYLYKITSKDFAQIQRHAREMVETWSTEGHEQFLNYLGQLNNAADGVHVVLSFNFERLFNAIAYSALARGSSAEGLECSQTDHFELIEPGFLKERLEGLL